MKELLVGRVKKLDFFGTRIRLNIDGQENFRTIGGAMISILLLASVLVYASYKFLLMATFSNTNLFSFTSPADDFLITSIRMGVGSGNLGTWVATLVPEMPSLEAPRIKKCADSHLMCVD